MINLSCGSDSYAVTAVNYFSEKMKHVTNKRTQNKYTNKHKTNKQKYHKYN